MTNIFPSFFVLHVALFILSFCLPTTTASTPLSSRFAHCSATTNYDCGYQIGQSQAHRISKTLTTPHGQSLIQFITTEKGKSLYQYYYNLHVQVFPHLVDEIRGLAKGANVDFNHLFALNLEFELMSKGNVSNEGYVKGCTDYHVLGDVNAWAHNEDGALADNDLFYFVAANVTTALSSTIPPSLPSPSSTSVPTSYFSFTYAGRLSGWAWSYNTHGLVFTVNGLYVLPYTKKGLGINFVARDLLDAVSVSDVIVHASRSNQDGGSHFNIGDIHTKEQISIETGSQGTTVQLLDGTNGNAFYAHQNQYLHTDQPHYGDYISSMYRMARTTTLVTRLTNAVDNNKGFILDVLGDQGGGTTNDIYCIHRCNTQEDPYVTYVTVLVDLNEGMLSVYSNRTNSNSMKNWWWKVDLNELVLPSDLPLFPY